jgi:pyruvate,orthophosphate dikinase
MAELPVRFSLFGPGQPNILPAADYGNKASGLSSMAAAGIPVPPGFVLPVAVCEEYYRNDGRLPCDVPSLLMQGISSLEKATGYTFGGVRKPLLVSVRSGAPVSMPGIMDTILNVGLTPVTVRALLALTGNPRFVYDTYRRFLESFGTSILSHPAKAYAQDLKDLMKREGISDERELDYQSLRSLCHSYEEEYTSLEHQTCLSDVWQQLAECTTAVLRSFDSPRANTFRSTRLIGEVGGTAVTVQLMVFGNMGASSGAGVAFTRNPWTGSKDLLVDFRFGGQGEDVVSGDREAMTQDELAQVMPDVYQDLIRICRRLEQHFSDMQDIEFTVQEGKLFLLQSRAGKRAPLAALRIAVDLAEEGIISGQHAAGLLEGIDLDAIEIQSLSSKEEPVGRGISASGGVASGTIALTPDRAELDTGSGPVILVRETASPDDITAIDVASGLLTARGARTSHAAVVARQLGKVCVVNCTDLVIDIPRHRCTIGQVTLREGEMISLDGNTGTIYRGEVSVRSERPSDLIATVKSWQASGS